MINLVRVQPRKIEVFWVLNFKDVYCDIERSTVCINNIADILLFRIYFRLIRSIALPVSLIETKCLSFLN